MAINNHRQKYNILTGKKVGENFFLTIFCTILLKIYKIANIMQYTKICPLLREIDFTN